MYVFKWLEQNGSKERDTQQFYCNIHWLAPQGMTAVSAVDLWKLGRLLLIMRFSLRPLLSTSPKRPCSLSLVVVSPPPIAVCLSLLTPSDNRGAGGGTEQLMAYAFNVMTHYKFCYMNIKIYNEALQSQRKLSLDFQTSRASLSFAVLLAVTAMEPGSCYLCLVRSCSKHWAATVFQQDTFSRSSFEFFI